MGLDIHFYEKVKIAEDHPHEWEEDGETRWCQDRDGHSVAHICEGAFALTQRGLPKKSFHFNYIGKTERWSKGYSNYNDWREQLYALVEPGSDIRDLWKRSWASEEDQKEHPFLEILHFSDAEGSFSGEVAAELLQDFRDFEANAKKTDEDLEDFQQRYSFYAGYRSYMRGLEIVGPQGLVVYR